MCTLRSPNWKKVLPLPYPVVLTHNVALHTWVLVFIIVLVFTIVLSCIILLSIHMTSIDLMTSAGSWEDHNHPRGDCTLPCESLRDKYSNKLQSVLTHYHVLTMTYKKLKR